MNQTEQVLDYIRKYGSISSFEAFKDLGITRLSGRIYDLKEQGYEFEKESVSFITRLGKKGSYAVYRLKE